MIHRIYWFETKLNPATGITKYIICVFEKKETD